MNDGHTAYVIAVDTSDWSDALRREYAEIVRGRSGAPLTADELVEWLTAVERRNRAHAGDPLADPQAEAGGTGLLDRRVPIEGTAVVLRLPTIAARIRIEAAEREEASGRADPDRALRWTAYCLAHGHDPDAMAALGDADAAGRVVDAWAARALTCSEHAVRHAVYTLMRDVYPEADEDPDPGGARPPTGPAWFAAWSSTSGAPRSTGSTAPPNPMPSGCCGRPPGSSVAANGCSRANPDTRPPSTPTTPRSSPSGTIERSSADSGRCRK